MFIFFASLNTNYHKCITNYQKFHVRNHLTFKIIHEKIRGQFVEIHV